MQEGQTPRGVDPCPEGGQREPRAGTPVKRKGGTRCVQGPPTADAPRGAQGGQHRVTKYRLIPLPLAPRALLRWGGRLLQSRVHGDGHEAMLFQGLYHGDRRVGVHEVRLHVHRAQVHTVFLQPEVPHHPAQHGPGQAGCRPPRPPRPPPPRQRPPPRAQLTLGALPWEEEVSLTCCPCVQGTFHWGGGTKVRRESVNSSAGLQAPRGASLHLSPTQSGRHPSQALLLTSPSETGSLGEQPDPQSPPRHQSALGFTHPLARMTPTATMTRAQKQLALMPASTTSRAMRASRLRPRLHSQ